jgi:hypothetical protein
MTHEAIVFRLFDLRTGRVVGEAVVCAPVRYAAVRVPGGDRLSRCHASVATWQRIRAVPSLGLPSGPLEDSSAIVELLVPQSLRSSVTLQYVVGLPVDAEPALTIAARVDAAFLGVIAAWNALSADS